MAAAETVREQRDAARAKGREARAKAKADLHEEIMWLRSFGWSTERIMRRLGISRSAVEKHLAAERERES